MIKSIEIKKDVFWVGVKDWNVRNFHGYLTQKGTTYNAYLIKDEKNVLIDAVKPPFFFEYLERIKSIIDLDKIDYIVSNHVELDHSGTLADIIKLCPNATVVTSINGEKGLKNHFDTSSWKLKVVPTMEKLNIGKRNLEFIHVPMIHWPDSMMTYLIEDQLLLPNDAFGQHLADSDIFVTDQNYNIVMQEAAKYYANIVYPYGTQVEKVLDAAKDLKIDMIAPSHGMIWPKEYIPSILKKYRDWATHQNVNKAVIIYDSMWGATEMMAQRIKFTFEELNVPVIERSLKASHISEVITDVLEAKYIAIGSPTLNNTILPTLGSFLTYMKGLAPKNKVGISFGAYGWFQKGLAEVDQIMNSLGWKVPCPPITAKYRPNEATDNEIREKIRSLIC